MKTQNKCLVSGLIAALLIPVSVQAADPPRCNELPNDAQRLGCYDAVFGKPVGAGAQAARVAPAAPVAPAAAVAPVAPAAPVAPVAAVAVGSAAAPAVAAAPAAAPPAPKPAKVEAFKSSVTALSHAADGRFIATLDNSQQWLQTERDSREEVKVGDTVTLQPGMFASWTLVTKSGYTARVKRLN